MNILTIDTRYGFFLSRLYLIFGHHPQIGVVLNIIFSLGIITLSYYIVRRIWHEQIARWVVVGSAVKPDLLLSNGADGVYVFIEI